MLLCGSQVFWIVFFWKRGWGSTHFFGCLGKNDQLTDIPQDLDGLGSFLTHISCSCVKIRLHSENELPRLPDSALKVCLEGGLWVGGPTKNLSLG